MYTKQERQRHIISMAASILGMVVVIAPLGWFMVQPVLISAVSSAMAADVNVTIDEKLAPIQGGFVAIITQNINRIRRDIGRLEYIRTTTPANFTPTMNADLINLNIDLDGQQAALAALQ